MIEELNIPKNSLLKYLKDLRAENRVKRKIIPSRLYRDEVMWSLTDRETYKIGIIRISAKRIGLAIIREMIENDKEIHEVDFKKVFKETPINIEFLADISKKDKLDIVKDQHNEWKITASKKKEEW